MELYYIRHGEPDYELDSLTERGHYQAEETAKYLSNIKFDYIFSSSHGRAIATAKHLTDKNHMEIIQFDWAREDNAGSQIGLHDENNKFRWFFDIPKYRDKLFELADDNNWYDDSLFPPKIKEYFLQSKKEIDNWLLKMNIKHENNKYEIIGKTPDKVALFAHGGFGTVFFSLVMGMNYPKVIRDIGQLDTCGIFHFRIDDNGISLLERNVIRYEK